MGFYGKQHAVRFTSCISRYRIYAGFIWFSGELKNTPPGRGFGCLAGGRTWQALRYQGSPSWDSQTCLFSYHSTPIWLFSFTQELCDVRSFYVYMYVRLIISLSLRLPDCPFNSLFLNLSVSTSLPLCLSLFISISHPPALSPSLSHTPAAPFY